jgi:acetyl-CoA carboxylase carboxyltransferase component
MSTPQDQYRQVIKDSQDAVLAAVDAWTQTVQQTLGQLPSATAPSVDADQVVDQVFDFTEKLLETQRAFAKNLVRASASVAQRTTDSTAADV